jgi:heat shock protein HslJ
MATGRLTTMLRMTTRSLRILTAGLAAALLVTACGDDSTSGSPATAADLDGRRFLLVDSSGLELADEGTVSLVFEDGNLGASGGCNQLSGPYDVDDGVLTMGPMATTEMACEPASLMDQDMAVAEFLASTPTITLDGNDLALATDSITMTFLDNAVANPDQPLEGTTWQLTGTVTGETASSVPMGAEASLTIEGGQAAIDTGCNTGSGGVTVGEGTLSFGPIAVTKMACEPELMELEATVLSVLSGEATYEIDSDQLTVTNGDNALQFTAAS